ncbi:MAG: hypothetical protein IKE53_03095 [Clostridiales bacterium]|nr:hypothetical protein [Clostridiales bacterium]
MATLTRLASTLTAKFSPSQTLTDAFYIDGRLCGKRETRQADITIEKEERGYFFSVFTHPTIEGFEPGMLPPFEPQFRSLCNDVKFGHKEIDGLIEKFLSTAVEVTGKMRLSDNEMRSPYFSGIIVRDAEAFAVTVGNGLAFLYRDDTLFPLTDAGIPMEAIDAFDNRVGDFMYYCASKTANALWSNYFTLSPDDCIILCNKAVYDALGQRELLRILNEAEDQCDAAGVVITQASARMPNVPMQFSISFVENVTNTDKRGIFGFKKKSRDDDEEENNVESVVEGGVVGAAAEAASDAGFVSLTAAESAGSFVATQSAAEGAVVFGEAAAAAVSAPAVNQVASPDLGIQVGTEVSPSESKLEFLDGSVDGDQVQITPEDLMKNAMNNMNASGDGAASDNMETISISEFNPMTATDDEPTKPITSLDSSIFAGLKQGGVLEQAIKDTIEPVPEPVAEEVPEIVSEPVPEEPMSFVSEAPQASSSDEIVFDAVDDSNKFMDVPTEESFNPYSAGDPEEMKNAAPLIFGDDSQAQASAPVEEAAEEVSEIPVPDFEIENPKPDIDSEDKLNVDFPEAEEKTAEPAAEPADGFRLPFANDVDTVGAPEMTEQVPDMPEYDANVYDTPVNAVNSEQPIDAQVEDTYAYGGYEDVQAADQVNGYATAQAPQEDVPYQPYGGEVFQTGDQANYQTDNSQQYQTSAYSGYQDMGEGNYSSEPAASVSSSAGSGDDAWIMDLLGVDDNASYGREDIPGAETFVAGGAAAAAQPQAAPVQNANPRGTGYNAADGGPNRAHSQGAQRPGGTRPRQPGSANGGNRGGGKTKFKLNRNGYIFIVFVVLLIVCLTIIISLIVKSCSEKTSETSSSVDDPLTTSETTIPTQPVETSATETTAENPSAPIASFKFSNYIGYRTWWDLFHYVYDINLSDLSDPRIQIIKDYNNFPADYTPQANSEVLLPPKGVIEGTIPNTFTPSLTGDTQAGTDTQGGQDAGTGTGGEGQVEGTPQLGGADYGEGAGLENNWEQ